MSQIALSVQMLPGGQHDKANYKGETTKNSNMRKLASIQKITTKIPIEGTDLIELVRINNWHIVVAKMQNNLPITKAKKLKINDFNFYL